MSTFALWAFGDAHVGTDLKRGRQSLATALRMVERAQVISTPMAPKRQFIPVIKHTKWILAWFML